MIIRVLLTLSAYCCLILPVLFSNSVLSENSQAYTASIYTKERADLLEFANNFAKKHDKNANKVMAILLQGKSQLSILEAIARPAEKRLIWGDYRKIFVEPNRVKQGLAFWKENKILIDKISQEYQVAAEIIVAIIGVETRYGRITGSYRVLDALMTLGFDYPPRSKFFLGQLEEFLLLADEQQLDPTVLKGSYAGAMGYGQFIPGSYRAYAVDYDKDGVADIWNNKADAIASVANYFAKHRWSYDNLVAIQLPDQSIDKTLVSKKLKPNISIAALRKAGVSLPKELIGETKVLLMQHETANGNEYWLGFDNFYTITRYNHSSMYALSTFQLGQLLKLHLDMP